MTGFLKRHVWAAIGLAAVALLVWLVLLPRSAGQSLAVKSSHSRAEAITYEVRVQEIDDYKTVFATIRSRDRVEARVRIPGTVAELKVDEGRSVKAGEVLALVADQKIALKMQALDAKILGARSRMETAKRELDRASNLLRRGVTSQAKYDQVKTAYDTAANELKVAEAERAVVARQLDEGQVLSPAEGRVLRVPVTIGTVMMPGESVATIAANAYLLRIELPERHARFMKAGDSIRVGARGLSPDRQMVGEGRIVQVYPELQGGRVVADAEAKGLGDFFIGERALVWISTGKRQTITTPRKFVFTRFGLDFVRLSRGAEAPLDVVVQLGEASTTEGGVDVVEVLTGLNAGDILVQP